MFTRTLQGHTHQSLLGLQGLSSSFHTDPSTWGPYHLDTIVIEGNSLYLAIVREQFNRNVTTLLTHSDMPFDLTVVGGLYQQWLGATYFWTAHYLLANVDVLTWI